MESSGLDSRMNISGVGALPRRQINDWSILMDLKNE